MSTNSSTPRKTAAKKAPAKKAAAGRPRKQPTDHLKSLKAEATDDPSLRRVTVEGVVYTIDPAVIDDVNMVEMIGDIQYNDEGHLSPLVIRKLIGVKAWQAWKDSHVDADTGRVPVAAMSTFLYSLFGELNSGN